MKNTRRIESVIIVGDTSTGKTSLLRRFCENSFDPYPPTQEMSSTLKEYQIKNTTGKIKIIIDFIDSPGDRKKIDAVIDEAINQIKAIILVYDITNRQTFLDLSLWVKKLKKKMFFYPIILIGNKIDLERSVTKSEAITFAESENIEYFETSAKKKQGIEDAFTFLLMWSFYNTTLNLNLLSPNHFKGILNIKLFNNMLERLEEEKDNKRYLVNYICVRLVFLYDKGLFTGI